MRKVKDSAAVALDKLGLDKAVDLGSEQVLAGVRRQARRAAMKPQVTREQVRIQQRIRFLERKASRMPIGNGRRKVQIEIDQLLETARVLGDAAEGKKNDTELKLTGSSHVDRAVGLAAALRAP